MKNTIKSALAAVLSLAAGSAFASIIVFTTDLSSAQEPVPTSTATGRAVVSFDTDANSVSVQLSFAGLANSQPFGHIHCCTAAAFTGNSPVLLDFGTLPATATGSFAATFTLTAANFTRLFDGTNTNRAYVNIHTPGTYAAGEIRGFLRSADVPLPSGALLLGAGLMGLTFSKRKK
jgi:hypothetical protein